MTALDIKQLFSRPGAPAYPFRDDHGQLCWLEPITEQGGRLALKQSTPSGERIVTPPGFQIRSRVHEYGGKCFCLADGQVYFNNFSDGLIYRQDLHSDTPPVAVLKATQPASQYADLQYSPAQNAIVAVQEMPGETAAQNRNQLVVFSLDQMQMQTQEVQVLAYGADFYAAPQCSDAGDRLAWLQWDNPHMPWDSSTLMCADLSLDKEEFTLQSTRKIAGGEASSVCQPGFLRNGGMVFAMDADVDKEGDTNSNTEQNFWNLYKSDAQGVVALTRDQAEFGEAHWVFGQCRWVQRGSSILAIRTQQEMDTLVEIDLDTGMSQPVAGPYARISQLSQDQASVLLVAEYVDKPAQLLAINAEGEVSVLKSSPPWLAEAEVSRPVVLNYPTRDGEQAWANFYPATGGVDGQTPALLVLVHGGPTSRSDTAISPLVQYFAQNGFAVLDVNHRGSTGHGRAYRQALLGQWGEIDADDIADAIGFAVKQHGLDPGRVFIRGGSAGGYAVLRALTRFPELFCGGACYYGIGNLITLSEITHKFEGRYTDQLIGERYSPESAAQAGSRFRSRSPIFDIARIKSPLILFQGLDDKVVPPEVSREMVRTLEQNGVKHDYIEYPGEGHGFRQAATKIDALSREIAFYREILSS